MNIYKRSPKTPYMSALEITIVVHEGNNNYCP